MRTKGTMLCLVALALVWLAASAHNATEATAGTALPALEAADVCTDDASVAISTDGMTQAKPGCKKCQGREWCECTYQGKPRISCNPCCYQAWNDPFPVCFD